MATAAKPRDKLTLRDTTDLYALINRWVEDNIDTIELNGGALPDDLANLLDEVDVARSERADAIAAKLDEFHGYIETAKAAKDRAARRQRVWENTAAALKRYVLREMDVEGVDRFRGVTATLRRQINSSSAVTIDGVTTGEAEQAFLEDIFEAEDPHPLMRFVSGETVYHLNRKKLAQEYEQRKRALEADAAILNPEDTAQQEQYVAEVLRAEFPAIACTRGHHLRVD